GAISQYNAEKKYEYKNLSEVIPRRIRMEGILSADFYLGTTPAEFARDMGEWIKTGKIAYREFVVEGIERSPDAFVGMLKGADTGKQIIKLA
ncbi:hypothetical protein BDK51DRAFT_46027, partial [Blyttiomyces helicus]